MSIQPNPIGTDNYQRWLKRSAYLTLSVAALIMLLKLTAAGLTNAASALASFMDSLLDLCISLLHFFAIRQALKPADAKHRFGHGKIEALMALFQAAFLLSAAALLSYQGVHRLQSPAPIGQLEQGTWLTLVCMLLTVGLVLAQRWIIRRTGSLAVKADLLHYQSDLLLNSAVLLAFFLVANSLLWADAAVSLMIAGFLCWQAQRLARESMQHLLDAELPDPERQRILQQLQQQVAVLGVDQLRTRQAGPMVFIQLRLVVADELSLTQAHQIADAAEHQLSQLYPHAEVMIHVDPLSLVPTPEYHFQQQSPCQQQ